MRTALPAEKPFYPDHSGETPGFGPRVTGKSMSLVLDEHREYLSDRNRLDVYARAIAELVKPGAVVVDLGAGTGIMGLLACRAGAATNNNATRAARPRPNRGRFGGGSSMVWLKEQ